MSTAPPSARPPAPGGADRSPGPLPMGTRVTVGILLIIPLIALALVPTYAQATPRLFGFPFFYWYSMMWVPVTACFTYAAYYVIAKARGVK